MRNGFTPEPRLAVVIVTRNRWESLARTLQHLQGLEAPFPIVVVDNNSQDGTRDLLHDFFPGVRLIPLAQNQGAVARDYGVRAVRQPYVAFSDDDSWWVLGSLSRAIALFEAHARLGLVMSRVLVGPEERLDPMCELMRRTPLPADARVPGFPILGFVACGAVVRRSAYLSAGGFHPRFTTGGEERLLALSMAQLGWRLSYVPDVVSHHHASDVRNMERRYRQGERNRLWTIWLRRRPRQALRLTLRLLRESLAKPEVRHGFAQALAGLPWVLRQRDPISPRLEAQLALLEKQRRQEAPA